MKYTIKKGSHSSGFRFCPVISKKQEVMIVKFDWTCAYLIPGKDQKDWNKLFGWSYLAHQNNSVRWGWRYTPLEGVVPRAVIPNGIQIAPYLHSQGSIIFPKEWIDVPIGKEIELGIHDMNDCFLFTADSQKIIVPYSGIKKFPIGYKLYPYFGGNQTAPHDVSVWMKKVSHQ